MNATQQDPRTTIRPEPVHDKPYWMIVNKSHPEFVRYVNGVLQQLRDIGTLNAIDEHWLGKLRPTPTPPAPRYQD